MCERRFRPSFLFSFFSGDLVSFWVMSQSLASSEGGSVVYLSISSRFSRTSSQEFSRNLEDSRTFSLSFIPLSFTFSLCELMWILCGERKQEKMKFVWEWSRRIKGEERKGRMAAYSRPFRHSSSLQRQFSHGYSSHLRPLSRQPQESSNQGWIWRKDPSSSVSHTFFHSIQRSYQI